MRLLMVEEDTGGQPASSASPDILYLRVRKNPRVTLAQGPLFFECDTKMLCGKILARPVSFVKYIVNHVIIGVSYLYEANI